MAAAEPASAARRPIGSDGRRADAAARPRRRPPRPPASHGCARGSRRRAHARADPRPALRHRRTGAAGSCGARSLAADVVGLVLAFTLAELVFGPAADAVNKVSPWVEFGGFLVTLPLWLVLARLLGLYDSDEEHADHTTVDDATGVFVLVTVGAFLLIALAWVTGLANPYMPKLLTFWLAAIVLVSLMRAAARSRVRRTDAYVQNTVIVGAGDVAQLLGSKILRHPEYGINLLGFVDMTPPIAPRRHRRPDRARQRRRAAADRRRARRRARDRRVRRRGSGEAVRRSAAAAEPGRADRRRAAFLRHRRPGRELPRDRRVPARRPAPGAVAVVVADAEAHARPRRQRARSARPLHRCSLFVAIRIKLDSPGPVFYRHERVGRGGTTIDVFKFRTMRSESSAAANATAATRRSRRSKS